MFIIRREPHNPILMPQHDRPWESLAAFNPSVVRTDDGVQLFYRALGSPNVMQTPSAELSSIGTAFSEDGLHFHSRQQIIAPQEPWDKFGCEDPRVTFFEGRWYCFYTALGGYPFGPDNIKAAVAVGDSPYNFTERYLVTPFNAKACALFPERVSGKVALLLSVNTDRPPAEVCVAYADRVEDFFMPGFWDVWYADFQSHKLSLRRGGSDHVEVGSTPVLTDRGWLILYSYIENYFGGGERVFSVEAALLARNNPLEIVSRTESIFIPQEIYEQYGLVPNIVFPTGATIDAATGMLDIWYGAADTVCAKASVRLADLLEALDPEAHARTFLRAPQNPILTPQGDGFESRAVFNAAAIDLNGTVHILYRAMDSVNTSTIGLALSHDGVTIDERLAEPIYTPRADFEMKHGSPTGNSGCEDPRIVRIEDTLYMTYTAYDGVRSPAGALTSISVEDFLARRFDRWSDPFILTPSNVDDKDLALLPGKIDGAYVLYHRINNTICADILPDTASNKRASRCIEIMAPRRGMWDGAKVGSAAPLIPAGDTWLMIYHGVSRHATYRLGAALLNPTGTEVLARTADPIFEPTQPYELAGEVANVVFSCGTVVRGDTLFLYYGAADKVIGVATASLSHIIKALS
ncbi:MAG: hypothetical protein WCT45_00595 [Candidatus Paceibacterota bacterium]|jgi:predicted GH43/DUF377 family glycosyl hydrolase